MSESKHSPAPWTICNQNECECGSVYSGEVQVAVAIGPSHSADYDPKPTREAQKANALLITAAPEMYEALKAQQEADEHYAECRNGCTDTSMCTEMHRLSIKAHQTRRAALSKAEGRE